MEHLLTLRNLGNQPRSFSLMLVPFQDRRWLNDERKHTARPLWVSQRSWKYLASSQDEDSYFGNGITDFLPPPTLRKVRGRWIVPYSLARTDTLIAPRHFDECVRDIQDL